MSFGSFPNVQAEELLLKLDEVGICASAGSACSSGQSTPSHVLIAIGVEKKMADGTLRITIGDENTKEDIEFLVEQLKKIIYNNA